MNKIKIILDPYDICDEDGVVVKSPLTEKEAFGLIDSYLKKNINYEKAKMFIVKGAVNCRHFNAYRNVTKGIAFDEITPRSRIKEIFHYDCTLY